VPLTLYSHTALCSSDDTFDFYARGERVFVCVF